MTFLGIDIGGTGIKAALVSQQGQVQYHMEMPTRAQEGAAAVLGRVEYLARALVPKATEPILACGVGTAGRVDHRRGQVLFAGSNLPGWTGLAVGPELERRLGLPVTVDNDVNAAALAEGWLGAARGCPDYAMVAIGTGVGGAAVLAGRIWRGGRSGAGEVGHTVLYPGGLSCTCGGTGCAEQYVSAKALTRRANQAIGDGAPFRGIREVLGAAGRGDGPRCSAARHAVVGFTTDLALVLISVQQMLDPQILIIGGGIVKLGYWWDELLAAVARESRPRSLTVRLRRAQFGPQAGVVGAARLAMLAWARTDRKAGARLASAGHSRPG